MPERNSVARLAPLELGPTFSGQPKGSPPLSPHFFPSVSAQTVVGRLVLAPSRRLPSDWRSNWAGRPSVFSQAKPSSRPFCSQEKLLGPVQRFGQCRAGMRAGRKVESALASVSACCSRRRRRSGGAARLAQASARPPARWPHSAAHRSGRREEEAEGKEGKDDDQNTPTLVRLLPRRAQSCSAARSGRRLSGPLGRTHLGRGCCKIGAAASNPLGLQARSCCAIARIARASRRAPQSKQTPARLFFFFFLHFFCPPRGA